MRFIFEQHLLGGDRNFGYLIGDRETGEAALVDPSNHPEMLLERASQQHLEINWILNTHSHQDHTNGNSAVKKATGAPLAAHVSSPERPDFPLEDGAAFAVGSIEIQTWHVPGHCSDHLIFYIPSYDVCITGDHLFIGKIGGTMGDTAAREQWDSFQKMFKNVADTATIWPGHHFGCRPSSTLSLEKATNPFLLCKTFEEFLDLKQKWPSFKVQHGLC